MKNKYFINILACFLVVFAAGCAQKNDIENENQNNLVHNLVHIKMLSKELKISASGLLKKDGDGVKIRAYLASQPAAQIEANFKRVCVSKKCASNRVFNLRFFGLKSDDAIMLKLLKFQRLEGVFKYPCEAEKTCFKNTFARQIFEQNSLKFFTDKSKIVIKKLN